MNEDSTPTPSTPTHITPNPGAGTDPNPGERSSQAAALGVPPNSLGIRPSRGNRAGGGQEIDTGARVGIMRNLEFTAGGRAHRLITGTDSPARPAYDPRSGHLHTSAVLDTNDPSLGPKSPRPGHTAMTPPVEGAGDSTDGSTGDTSPDRRRDKDTT
jgi:hypothetical protein